MLDKYISLAHGNGGRFMRELIEEVFARHLAEDCLDVHADAATISMPPGDLMVTTDGFTVQPLEFPGGDIGSLAVHGTTNDLAVAGALPLYLTLNVFIEEGFEVALLERLVQSMARAARALNVRIVAGDTKVLRRGEVSGLYLATTGTGVRQGPALSLNNIRAGDRILVSGPVGDHGTAIMLAREDFGLSGNVQSDAGSVLPLTQAASAFSGLRFMRDPTRGGLASVSNEIHQACGMGVRLYEPTIPLRDPVKAVCEILGYDPYYLACEGRVVAVVEPQQADELLQAWRALPEGKLCADIGVIDVDLNRVVLQTELGGERLLEELEDDPLPRIC